jgi:hypothetical protein
MDANCLGFGSDWLGVSKFLTGPGPWSKKVTWLCYDGHRIAGFTAEHHSLVTYQDH